MSTSTAAASAPEPISSLSVDKIGACIYQLGKCSFSWTDQRIADQVMDPLINAALALSASGDTSQHLATASTMLGLLISSTGNLPDHTTQARVQAALVALTT